MEIFATKSTSAEEVAEILYREIFARFGAVVSILTDRGTSFRNNLLKSLCKLLDIKQSFTSSYHPETDGKCERMNQTVIKSLKLICENQKEWVRFLTPVLMAYRASVATPHGMSPHFALFGRHMRLPLDLQLMDTFDKAPDMEKYITDLVPKLKITHEIIQQNLRDSNKLTKNYYDKKTVDHAFEVGTKVLLHDPTNKKGDCKKLKRRWAGPFLVVDKSEDGLLYKLRHCNTGKEQRSLIHINRLKQFNEERDRFFMRNAPTRDSASDISQSPNQSVSDSDLGDGWFEIIKLTGKKKIGGKKTYMVHWKGGSKSREPEENVSEFAKIQYEVALKQRQKNRRRKKN